MKARAIFAALGVGVPHWLAVGLVAGLAACGSPDGAAPGDPLFDGAHRPDVLVEASRVEPPPSTGGNRFLTGWAPEVREGELLLAPEPGGARIEIAHLAPRPRRLTLHLAPLGAAAGGRLRIRAGAREIGWFALASRIEVELPAGLPIGRLPVSIEPGVAPFAVRSIELADPLPAGEARIEDGGLVQEGESVVDLVRRVEAGARLAGRLTPPAGAGDDQSFALRLQRQGEPVRTVFEWRPRWWRRDDRPVELDVPLGEPGFVRIRLVARGDGPPARWSDLRLTVAAPTAEPAAQPIPAAPRLVVVVVLDALRADHVGHLARIDPPSPDGAPDADPKPWNRPGTAAAATPEIDRLASGGATFLHAFSVAPNTRPSTKTLFTGLVFLTTGGRKLPADGPTTLAERFARAGYRTAMFTGNGYITRPSGLARGFEHAPRETRFSPSGRRRGGSAHNGSAERVNRGALAWLDGLPPGERAFLLLQPVIPHNPYAPPEPHLSRFTAGIPSSIDGSTRTLLAIRDLRRRPSAADRARLRALYAGNLAHADAQLGRLVSELERRYPSEEILLVVTSDHGEELFDHGGVLHGYTLYDEQIRVPLVVRWPGRVEARRIEGAVDTADLHATLAALADGAEPSLPYGRSLWPFLGGREPGPRGPVFAAASNLHGGIFTARSLTMKVIYAPRAGPGWGMGHGRGRDRDIELVFDLRTDPGEHHNLAGEDRLEAAWLRSRLLAWIDTGKALEVGGVEERMDAETLDNLRQLGYVE